MKEKGEINCEVQQGVLSDKRGWRFRIWRTYQAGRFVEDSKEMRGAYYSAILLEEYSVYRLLPKIPKGFMVS